MSLSILQIIAARAPQYNDNPRLNDIITLSKLMTTTCLPTDKYNYAVALRTIHILAVEERNGGSDSSSGTGSPGVVSEKEDTLSRTYKNSSNNGNDDLSSTQYGLELQALLKGNIITFRNRFTGVC